MFSLLVRYLCAGYVPLRWSLSDRLRELLWTRNNTHIFLRRFWNHNASENVISFTGKMIPGQIIVWGAGWQRALRPFSRLNNIKYPLVTLSIFRGIMLDEIHCLGNAFNNFASQAKSGPRSHESCYFIHRFLEWLWQKSCFCTFLSSNTMPSKVL